jgi:hypothetical protein
MHPHGAESALWYSSIALDVALCALMVWRRFYRRLPVFAIYVAVLLAREIFLYWTYRAQGYNALGSFYSYWMTEGLAVAVRGLAIGELAWSASRLYPGFRAVLKWSLTAVAAVFLLYSSTVAFTNARRLPSLILGLERDLNLTAAVALLVLLGLSQRYDVFWDVPRKLIALGFFVFSVLQVPGNAISIEFVRSHFYLWNVVRTLSFEVAQVLWIFALIRNWPQVAIDTPEPTDIEALRALVRDGNERLRLISARLSRFRKAWKP